MAVVAQAGLAASVALGVDRAALARLAVQAVAWEDAEAAAAMAVAVVAARAAVKGVAVAKRAAVLAAMSVATRACSNCPS